MQDGQPSRTALMTAIYRAREHLFAPEPKIVRDSLAMALAGLPDKAAMDAYMDQVTAQFAALSDQSAAEAFITVSSEVVCLRARLVEETFKSLMDEGLEQVVILGAGLDSMAYRYGGNFHDIRFYEVDHPATQAWKRQCLDNADVTVPANMRFVSFDFENQTLAEALNAGGIDPSKKTLFSWLGVHMYLTDDTVKATLAVLGGFAKGSTLVMDFLMPDYNEEGNVAPDGVKQLQKVVADMGEPIRSLYTLPELENRLRDAGFSTIQFPSVGDLIDLYLDGQQDRLLCPKDLTTLATAQI